MSRPKTSNSTETSSTSLLNAPWKTWPTPAKQAFLSRILDQQAEKSRQAQPEAERLSLIQWSEKHRRIKDKNSGIVQPFSLTDYPWMEHIYNSIGSLPPGGRVVIRKAGQMGATELALNMSFWMLDGRGSVFYALPPGPIQGDFAHSRVDPAISASPHIREIAGNIDNVGLKTFKGGFNFYIRGTAIPHGDPSRAAQLSEAPADLAAVDEFDRIPSTAIPLIRERLGDSRLKWEIDLSTPTYPDLGIDREYQDTTQHEPKVRCERCGQWHALDWKMVRGPVAEDLHARLVCPTCGGVIERAGMWQAGRARYEARYPDRPLLGFWVPKLCSERADLDELWNNSQSHEDSKVQTFWNSGMGLAYEPKGARLTRELIAACSNPAYPTFPDRAMQCAMGVDVGLELHYWIKQITPEGRERAVGIGSVLEWAELDVLMERYNVQRCVVDDRPELREDEAFARRWPGRVWLGLEEDSPDSEMSRLDRGKNPPRVHIERTKALDEACVKIQLGIDEFPADWENVPDIVEHLTTSIKAKRVRDDGTTTYFFPHTGRPDHLHHAKAFCEVAIKAMKAIRRGEDESAVADESPAAGDGRYRSRPMGGGTMRGRL